MMQIVLPLMLLAAATDPSDPFDETTLAADIWRRAPDVAVARQDLADAQAVADRSHLLPNPSLTATVGSLPIGARTPSSGETTFGEVPNYSVGVGQLFEIGKRRPRQAAAAAARDVAGFGVLDAYRTSFFSLMEIISDQAAAVARLAVLERLVAGSEESLRLQRARASRGDVAGLEVDRLEVEHLRLTSSLREAEGLRQGALGACSRILGRDCPRFTSEEQARGFLGRVTVPPRTDDARLVAQRSDLQGLRAQQTRLQAELALAEKQKIPDPVATLGYTRDQFVKAGNQANSVSVSINIPLPVFDRGQADIKRAKDRLANTQDMREVAQATALRQLTIGRAQIETLVARAQILDEQAVPLARSVAERMEAAARRGGAALPDVLLARRAMEELALTRVEVASAAYRASLDLRRVSGALPASNVSLQNAANPVGPSSKQTSETPENR